MITAVRTGAGGRAAAAAAAATAAVAVVAFGVSFARLKSNSAELFSPAERQITRVVYEDRLKSERIGDGIGARLRPNRSDSANDGSRSEKRKERIVASCRKGHHRLCT